ncbi:hypothetical protein JXB41_02315 [Candidatus Woesearchaeota archaeon]|nr:hypothetical protein [Candidatus Woesearchaeota archaeon]
MANAKKLDMKSFADIIQKITVAGELISATQKEKQSVMDEFSKEISRFKSGKISKKSLAASATKTNKEIAKLDAKIRQQIKNMGVLASRLRKLSVSQSPRKLTASVTSVSAPKKKKAAKKKAVKKKAVKKKAKKPATKKKAAKKKAKKRPASKKAVKQVTEQPKK